MSHRTTAPKKRNEIAFGVFKPVDEIPMYLSGASNLVLLRKLSDITGWEPTAVTWRGMFNGPSVTGHW